jgi:4-hydroxy-tetrahydrodipicolinate synthase
MPLRQLHVPGDRAGPFLVSLSPPARFGRVVTAMVTPFDDDLALDLDGARVLARHLVATGSEGLVVTGTTGEAPTLSDSEKIELWRAVAESVTVPVLAGAGTNDTAHSIRLTREATATGVAGILAVTPYYNRPSQAGLVGHFQAIAASTELPVLLYDIPSRTGRRISPTTLLELARTTGNVVGVKDAAGDVAATAALVAAVEQGGIGFEVYSGDDALTLALLAVGAVGVVSVVAHWAGRELQEMIECFTSGRVHEARQINAALIASYDFFSSEESPSPLPTKAMLRLLRMPAGRCRPPLDPDGAGLAERAAAVLAALRGTADARPPNPMRDDGPPSSQLGTPVVSTDESLFEPAGTSRDRSPIRSGQPVTTARPGSSERSLCL